MELNKNQTLKTRFLKFFTSLEIPKKAPPDVEETILIIRQLVKSKTELDFPDSKSKKAALIVLEFLNYFYEVATPKNIKLLLKLFPEIERKKEKSEIRPRRN